MCVPKHSVDDIRLCVDMHQANTAVKRVRHPIPTVDELLHEMNSRTIFSKLDVTWAYHQIELKPESRDITTFVTDRFFIDTNGLCLVLVVSLKCIRRTCNKCCWVVSVHNIILRPLTYIHSLICSIQRLRR